jgi:hypothetical protein
VLVLYLGWTLPFLTFDLLLDRDGLHRRRDLLSNEELAWVLGRLILQILVCFLQKAHLLMIRWREHFLVLSLASQLRREDLRFDVIVRSYVRNGQGNTLMHHLGVQILALDLLLPLTGQ